MKSILRPLQRFVLVTASALGMATTVNYFNYQDYWKGTIYRVQTTDFNLLSHMAPAKLSSLLAAGSIPELQRTLDSNFGLFGLIVTDCAVAEKICPQQQILFASNSDKQWRLQLSVQSLSNQLYDVLRDPPPILAEKGFSDPRASQWVTTGRTNQGRIIGRVYYVRGIPPGFLSTYWNWLHQLPQSLLSEHGADKYYGLTASTFSFAGFMVWGLIEVLLFRKWVLRRIAQLEQERLAQKNTELSAELSQLQHQLQEKLSLSNMLLQQLEEAQTEMRQVQVERQQQTEQAQRELAQLRSQRAAHERQQQAQLQQAHLAQQQTHTLLEEREQALNRLCSYIHLQQQAQEDREQGIQRLQEQLQALEQQRLSSQNDLMRRGQQALQLQKQIEAQQQAQQAQLQKLDRLQQSQLEAQQRYNQAQHQLQQREQEIEELRLDKTQQQQELQQRIHALEALQVDRQDQAFQAQRAIEALSQQIEQLQAEKSVAKRKVQELEQSQLKSLELTELALEAERTALENKQRQAEVLEAQFKQKEQGLLKAIKDHENRLAETKDESTAWQNKFCFLEQEKEKLAVEHSQAQTQLAELDEQLAQLSRTKIPSIDLSRYRLVIVGGHQRIRLAVANKLSATCRVTCTQVPPTNEAKASWNSVRDKIQQADCVALVTTYMGHDLSNIVLDLQRRGALKGKVLKINRAGETGIIKAIVDHFLHDTGRQSKG